jgi:SAM-dependent methyltransferase
MPTIAENLNYWNRFYDWPQGGDEWSAAWGGSEQLWRHWLRPRIAEFLPAHTILEIAPGFGRCTQFLKEECEQLILVDLSPKCIEACRRRFFSDSHISYHVNDGKSLKMVPDQSGDLAFSFDSLVHAEPDVLEAYVQELARKLAPNGVGFFHHSNLGQYPFACAIARAFPEHFGGKGWQELALKIFGINPPVDFRTPLAKRGIIINVGSWRARSMTAECFAAMCRRAGLCCIRQEKIASTWGRYLVDCLCTFTPDGSKYTRACEVLKTHRLGIAPA